MLCESFGHLISIHPETEEMLTLDVASLKIQTKVSSIINQSIKIRIDNAYYEIKIVEESWREPLEVVKRQFSRHEECCGPK